MLTREFRIGFRTIAGALALFGILWGVLVFPFTHSWTGFLLFLPGYILTVGYVFRAIANPSRAFVHVLWSVSTIVQGIWFLWAVTTHISEGRMPNSAAEWMLPAWWLTATICSYFGMKLDLANPSRSENHVDATTPIDGGPDVLPRD
jgi:hypothetical protein